MNRRQFFTGAATAAGGALLARLIPIASGAEPGKAATSTGKTEPFAPAGLGYKPVITPNGLTLPWKLVNGVKVYHLIAEPVTHEFAPGLVAECWGYSGRVHGPTIEAVEGDQSPRNVVGSFMGKEIADEMSSTSRNNAAPVLGVLLEVVTLEGVDLITNEAGDRHGGSPWGCAGGLVAGL